MTRSIERWQVGVAPTHAIACALVLAVALCAAGVSVQTIRARADGLLEVTDAPTGTVVRYTLDGTDPTRDAGVWPTCPPGTPSKRVRSLRITPRSGRRSNGLRARRASGSRRLWCPSRKHETGACMTGRRATPPPLR